MEDKEQLIDQTQLANSVSDKIHYDFLKFLLVKPLEPIMVEKEFDQPVPSEKQPTKDDNGIEAVDYDKVEKEIKTVESNYGKGVVLKIPYEYANYMNDEKYPAFPIKVGDVIVYRKVASQWFDILKDTQLVSAYDIVAVERTVDNELQ